ncbi:hypothetical protein ABZV31_05820 [Streptomyces sp. NPDC005202]|uniref:hypothetical protein n=1 Tax=Streptomyces sp. NPDC005202 TaxID=3157021 RepID=UPI0033B3A3BC
MRSAPRWHRARRRSQIDHVGYSAISLGWGGWPDKIGDPATSHDNAVRNNLIFDYMQMCTTRRAGRWVKRP